MSTLNPWILQAIPTELISSKAHGVWVEVNLKSSGTPISFLLMSLILYAPTSFIPELSFIVISFFFITCDSHEFHFMI